MLDGINILVIIHWFQNIMLNFRMFLFYIYRVDNVNASICVEDNPSIPCPDLIILGTTQVINIRNI